MRLACSFRYGKHLFLTVVLASFIAIYFFNSQLSNHVFPDAACHLPSVDPLDPEIVPFIYSRPRPVCSVLFDSPISYQVNQTLYINWTSLRQSYPRVSTCCYQSLHLLHGEQIDYSNSQVLNDSQVPIVDEFIRVQCFDWNKTVLYENFHAFPPQLPEKESRGDKEEDPNVLIILLDSVSQANFLRSMPETRRFLADHTERQSFLMKGYNKVADNTLPNVLPLLTGRTYEELTVMVGKYLDRWFYYDSFPFIWKEFAQRDYVTLYLEDDPEIGIFTAGRNGFFSSPTSYYFYPFTRAMWNSPFLNKSTAWCFADRVRHRIYLDYLQSFVLECLRRRTPFFAFVALGELTHRDSNLARAIDSDLRLFLESLVQNGMLKNTLLLLLADHGPRYEKIRATIAGKLEDRMPLLSMTVPERILDACGDAVRSNLQMNAQVLTTPFDVHATIKAVLRNEWCSPQDRTLFGEPRRGNSLFGVIPNRGCPAAGVEPHWCVCLERASVSPSNPRVVTAAESAVKHINSLLPSKCASLQLDHVINAEQLTGNDAFLRFHKASWYGRPSFGEPTKSESEVFSLAFAVRPSQALFEVTLRMSKGKGEVMGDISRLNSYGNESSCVGREEATLKKLCFCQ